MSIKKMIYLTLLVMLTFSLGAETDKKLRLQAAGKPYIAEEKEFKDTLKWLRKINNSTSWVDGHLIEVHGAVKFKPNKVAEPKDFSVENLKRLIYLKISDTYPPTIKEHDLKHLKPLQHLETFITDTQASLDLNYLTYLKQIRILNIRYTDLLNENLSYIGNLENLEILDINAHFVTDQGLVHLKNLKKLKELYMYIFEIEGPGLTHLKSLQSLQKLELYYSGYHLNERYKTHEKYIKYLQKALPNCKITYY